jgi:RNA polymerase sigma-70 factor (ECF subfamily)
VTPNALSVRFCEGLEERLRPQAEALADLEGRLRTLVEAARAVWPELAVAPEDFAAHAAGHLRDDAPLAEALAALRAPDLWLALACVSGQPAALRAFEARYFGEIDRALARLDPAAATRDDVRQIVREKLFVAAPGARPKIAEYAGRGDLKNWVRVTVVRTVLNLVTRGHRDIPVSSDLLVLLPAPGADPELDHARRLYRHELEEALAEAASALPARERSLLLYELGEGLGIDQIGALYGVHRSTAARWLARAREKLLGEVRRALSARLRIAPAELDSILRLLGSQLDVTIERVLRAAAAP